MALISSSHFLPLNTALYLMNQDMILRCIDKIPAVVIYHSIIKIKFPQCISLIEVKEIIYSLLACSCIVWQIRQKYT